MSNLCKFSLHKWNGCTCTKCGIVRNTQHDWSKDCEKCAICNMPDFNQHNWVIDNKSLLGIGKRKCTKCGKISEKQFIEIHKEMEIESLNLSQIGEEMFTSIHEWHKSHTMLDKTDNIFRKIGFERFKAWIKENWRKFILFLIGGILGTISFFVYGWITGVESNLFLLKGLFSGIAIICIILFFDSYEIFLPALTAFIVLGWENSNSVIVKVIIVLLSLFALLFWFYWCFLRTPCSQCGSKRRKTGSEFVGGAIYFSKKQLRRNYKYCAKCGTTLSVEGDGRFIL